MKKLILLGLILITATYSFAGEIHRPQYTTLVVKDLSFDGADMDDLSPENVAELNKVRSQLVSGFTETIKDYLEKKKIFAKITTEAKGSSDELILQCRYVEIQMGSAGRRMARYFTLGIPLGGKFDISMKGRLVDSSSGREILNQKQATNTGWYKGENDVQLLKFTKDLAIQFAELVESFMDDEFDREAFLNSKPW